MYIEKRIKYLKSKLKENNQYVYLMQNEFGRFKIGISQDVEKRRGQLQTGSGFYIKIIGYYKPQYRYAGDVEKHLHKLFAKYRTIGEWFEFPDTYSKEKFDTLCERVSMVEMPRSQDEKCLPFIVHDWWIQGDSITESKNLTEEYKKLQEESKKVTKESTDYWRKHYGIKPKRKGRKS